MNRTIFASVLLLFGLALGCGGADRATAKGRVTAAGQPVTTAMINFVNPTSGAAASCDLASDGSFSIEEGLAPGSYKVFVIPKSSEADAPKPGQMAAAQPKSPIPPKYRSDATSGLTVDIKPGANSDLQFALD